MKQALIEQISQLKGTLLVFGSQDPTIEQAILRNQSLSCPQLVAPSSKPTRFHLSKIPERFSKVDAIICEVAVMYPYFSELLPLCIRLHPSQLYFYGKWKDYEIDVLLRKLKRYHTFIELKCFHQGYLLLVNTEEASVKRIRQAFYHMYDFGSEVLDHLSDFFLR